MERASAPRPVPGVPGYPAARSPSVLRFVNEGRLGFALLFPLIAFALEPVCSRQSAPSSSPPELFDLLVWVQLFRFFAITSLEGGWP